MQRYWTLFDSMIEGFCTIEVLFDEDENAVDYRILETNPAFEKQTGLADAEGKRMRKLVPEHEDHWFEAYGRIAKTGESERFTNRARHLDDRWYEVHALRVGNPEDHKVAVFFWDVSEQRRLQREVVNASENVRREIGWNLHDDLSSDLAALTMKIGFLKDRLEDKGVEEARDLEPIADTLRKCANQARTMSHALVPVALQEEHAAAAVAQLCREQDNLSEFTCTFEGDRDETRPHDEENAVHLYRIAHQAVVNARRHADADHVRLSLRQEESDLVLTVWDDGTGLPDDVANASGLGLRLMRFRANLIGGTLSIENGQANGTTVQCKLPIGAVPLN